MDAFAEINEWNMGTVKSSISNKLRQTSNFNEMWIVSTTRCNIMPKMYTSVVHLLLMTFSDYKSLHQ